MIFGSWPGTAKFEDNAIPLPARPYNPILGTPLGC